MTPQQQELIRYGLVTSAIWLALGSVGLWFFWRLATQALREDKDAAASWSVILWIASLAVAGSNLFNLLWIWLAPLNFLGVK